MSRKLQYGIQCETFKVINSNNINNIYYKFLLRNSHENHEKTFLENQKK